MVSSDQKLTREGWDKLVKDRHGDGWEQVPAHKVLNPFSRVKKTGMLPVIGFIVSLAMLSCNDNGRVVKKKCTPIPCICEFEYEHNLHGGVSFEDSCNMYRVGDLIKME